MSWLGDVTDFINFRNFKGDSSIWKQIEDDPWRLLTGMGPITTGITNKLFGRDDEPIFDWDLGPTDTQFNEAEAAGMNLEHAKQAQTLAQLAMAGFGGASLFNSAGFSNAMGNMGGMFGGEGGGGAFDFGSMDWSNPSTYMDMMGQMPMGGGQQQPQQQAAMPYYGGGASSYSPMPGSAPGVYSPQRYQPFGLLNDDDEQKRMQALIGGLLA